MIRLLAYLLTALLSLEGMVACSTNNDLEASPSCTGNFSETLIEQLKQEPKRTPVAEVTQYTYQGQTVYLVTGGSGTVSNGASINLNYLFDSCGKVVCAASGGPNNDGDGICPDFKTTATNPVLIWRDPR